MNAFIDDDNDYVIKVMWYGCGMREWKWVKNANEMCEEDIYEEILIVTHNENFLEI